MVFARDIVLKNFILINGEQSLWASIKFLNKKSLEYVIVSEKHSKYYIFDKQTLIYSHAAKYLKKHSDYLIRVLFTLFKPNKKTLGNPIIERLCRNRLHGSLLDIIDKDIDFECSVVDGYSDAEFIPEKCIIRENNAVVGFYDSSLLTLTKKSSDNNSNPSTMPDSLYLNVNFPENVYVGETVSILVNIGKHIEKNLSTKIYPQDDLPIDIIIEPLQGFVLANHTKAHMEIPVNHQELPVQFKVKAIEIGIGKIRVYSFQCGLPVGMIELVSQISTDENKNIDKLPVLQRHSLASGILRQPDLTLLILESGDTRNPQISFYVTADDPSLNLNFSLFGPIQLKVEPYEFFQRFFKELEGMSLSTTEDRDIATKRLEIIGTNLFEQIIPLNLRSLLWDIRHKIKMVHVISNEPWIPWEVMKLSGISTQRTVPGPFFAEAYQMTRWFPGIARRPELRLSDWGIITPADSKLGFVKEELNFLKSLANEYCKITQIEGRWPQIVNALSEGRYNVLHFSGHGYHNTSNPDHSGLLLENNQQLFAEEICGQVGNCGIPRPLVFLNACQTGREGFSLTGIGGWAHRFIQAGAAGFIGSLWKVYDDSAFSFARAFYTGLLDGKPIGEAGLDARLSIRDHDNLTWLSYTIFADPYAQISINSQTVFE